MLHDHYSNRDEASQYDASSEAKKSFETDETNEALALFETNIPEMEAAIRAGNRGEHSDLISELNVAALDDLLAEIDASPDEPETSPATDPEPLPDDKSVNRSRRKSLFRDAQFVREYQCFFGDPDQNEPAFDEGTSVIVVRGSTHSPSPSPTPAPTPSTPARTYKRMSPWYVRLDAPTAIPYKTPAEWRDTTDTLRAHYYHHALRRLGPTRTFTLNLSPEIEAKARGQAKPLDWLRRRIDRQLQKHLNRRVEFFAVIEETDDRRLHLHGEIGINDTEAEIARKALRLAGGEWKHTRQHQAHSKPSPDVSWASYVIKGFWKTTLFARDVLGDSSLAVTFSGSVLSVSSDLRRTAEALYMKHRAELIARR